MLFIWILGILAALILLLCLIRIGIRLELHSGEITLDAKAAFLHFGILPGKTKEKKRSDTVSKKSEEAAGKPKQTLPKLSLAEIKELVCTLAPPLKRALNRTWRGIRLHPLQLSLTLGGAEDPASAAELYGYLHAGMWTLMPQAEQLMDIPDPHIHIGVDFDAPDTAVEARIGITIRIGTLLAAAFTIGIPMIRWLLRYRKKQTPAAKRPETVRT